MTIERLLFPLTVVNLVLLLFQTTQMRPAAADDIAPVLRGRALEIVDEQDRTRATITVLPAEPAKADGKDYPDTVILRLIDPHGRPPVKLTASVEGAALLLMGQNDQTYARLGARGTESAFKLTEDGRERVIEP
jgi:hypothetical protein